MDSLPLPGSLTTEEYRNPQKKRKQKNQKNMNLKFSKTISSVIFPLGFCEQIVMDKARDLLKPLHIREQTLLAT